MTRRAAVVLGVLVMVVAITAAWWAFALWPTGADAPAWIVRTRAVCFGVSRDGLPDLAGWVVLISEPLGMLMFLGVVWRDELLDAVDALRRTLPGRVALATAAFVVVGGVGAVTVRVAHAGETRETFDPQAGGAAEPARLDRPAPPLSLVDQHGNTVRLEDFRGRPVVIAFGYAHCQTVCPLVVHDAIAAVAWARARDPVLLIVTLDPWRDTPARLSAIAKSWKLPSGARLLGGDVEQVERTLDAWGIARGRDANTGEIVHPTSVYVIDQRGRWAFVAPSDPARLEALLGRL